MASEEASFRVKFEKLYTLSGLPIIDYRVREASHHFLQEVIANYQNKGILIEDQPWFYQNYSSDKTISSVVLNINIIRNFVIDRHLINDEFINYVQDYIEFWYFDTNISEQGEELYIYMNARGEQMKGNENIKADLLGKIKPPQNESKSLTELKNYWGVKWENWQQFFWLNKGDNPNADKGFNEYLNCIAGLENLIGKKGFVYSKEEFDDDNRGKKNQLSYSDVLDAIGENGLNVIEGYYEGLSYLFNRENIDQFKSNYQNITWVEKCLNEVLQILNSNSTNWFAKLNDPDRGLEHSRMVFIWSLLRYMNNRNNTTVSNTEVFRVLRVLYIRYNNYNRSVQSIVNDVEIFNNFGPWKTVGVEEEHKKNNWYTEIIKPEEIKSVEELIWIIEDHPLNLEDRKGTNAINCSHLIDFDSKPSIPELEKIIHKFYELFPIKIDGKVSDLNYKKLINTLLFYGEFWDRVSPWYCNNYHFGNWKKIIRNIDTKDKAFKLFFDDFKLKTLEEIYMEKVIEFDFNKETSSLSEQLKWFAFKLNEKLWEQGLYIAVEHYNYPNNDSTFINSREILNTKGDFKGGSPQVLSKLLKYDF